MQNIVTCGHNMSANIEEFACFSMGGLFSGVPPYDRELMINYFYVFLLSINKALGCDFDLIFLIRV